MIVIDSPIGYLRIQEIDATAASISLVSKSQKTNNPTATEQKFSQTVERYFSAVRSLPNSLPTTSVGTPFQQSVWQAICRIPPGEIRTYQEVAAMIGRPKAARAVGNALNKNPFLLQVPCHRVIPSGGSRTACGGFACGTKAKQWLLEYENN